MLHGPLRNMRGGVAYPFQAAQGGIVGESVRRKSGLIERFGVDNNHAGETDRVIKLRTPLTQNSRRPKHYFGTSICRALPYRRAMIENLSKTAHPKCIVLGRIRFFVKVANMKTLLVVLSGVVLTACLQTPVKDTVTLCDSDGCVERPRDYASRDTSTDPVENPRIAALESLARNDPRAAYDLALRYFRGDGVRQDSYKAIEWMRAAGESGDLQAQKALGRLYLTGLEEMGADAAEAEKWLMMAASRGDKESKELLAEATRAKKSERAYYDWQQRWRGVFYDDWYHRYGYRSYWRYGRWYYY